MCTCAKQPLLPLCVLKRVTRHLILSEHPAKLILQSDGYLELTVEKLQVKKQSQLYVNTREKHKEKNIR